MHGSAIAGARGARGARIPVCQKVTKIAKIATFHEYGGPVAVRNIVLEASGRGSRGVGARLGHCRGAGSAWGARSGVPKTRLLRGHENISRSAQTVSRSCVRHSERTGIIICDLLKVTDVQA